MSKKFNGHRCERRNLTDLVLGTGPDGKKRAKPKAKRRPKNYTTEPAANQMVGGGPTQAMFDLDTAIAQSPELQALLKADPGMYDRLTALNPGEVGDFLTQKLGAQGKANLISAGGQAVGSFISNMGDNASDPMSDYGFQEGLGAAVSGATNPLAMTFGPVGMGVGALVGLGKSFIGHQKEKEEFIAAEEEAKQDRIRGNVQSAQDFSRQVLSTYNQDGLGGGLYARNGGPLAKYFYGGPSNPPATSAAPDSIAGMDIASFNALQQRLNPELYAAVQNAPAPEPDRLTSYTDAEMRRYNAAGEQARIDAAAQENAENARQFATNMYHFHKDKPLDAIGMDLAVLGQVPVFGEVADVANAGLSGVRGVYNAAVGDTAKAKEQFALAGLSATAAIPYFGNASGAARVGQGVHTAYDIGKTMHHLSHGAHNLERGVIAGKAYKAGTHSPKMQKGGPVDYETEKSEVILASPNDPPIAVGQGSYKQVSGNLYKANGPSHEMGGIPTRGATRPFIDNTGQYEDSPYVFSDSKEMRFDASNILNMIR